MPDPPPAAGNTSIIRCMACYGDPDEVGDCAFCIDGYIDETGMPPRVDPEDAWGTRPATASPRLGYWLERIAAGTCPDFPGEGYYSGAELAGVTIWEEINVIWPSLAGHGHGRPSAVRAWLRDNSLRDDLQPDLVTVPRPYGEGWAYLPEGDPEVEAILEKKENDHG